MGSVSVTWWWCLVAALNVLNGVLSAGSVAILSAANGAGRLPWIGRPARNPGWAVALQLGALVAFVLAMSCVEEALGRQNAFDGL
jgi:hypothetical protein